MSESLGVTHAQVDSLRRFISHMRTDPFVVRRYDRNVRRDGQSPDRALFWKGLVSCLLTTQQRASPGMPVWRFMKQEPFPLAYTQVKSRRDVKDYVAASITTTGGIRFIKKIPGYAAHNLAVLESGLWAYVDSLIQTLWVNEQQSVERVAAETLRAQLLGLGPKQSRNILQLLGLTRYEIPIDSRMLKWLTEFGIHGLPDARMLSRPRIYIQVLDWIQELCRRADVYPCIFDAAVFSSMDNVSWRAGDIVF